MSLLRPVATPIICHECETDAYDDARNDRMSVDPHSSCRPHVSRFVECFDNCHANSECSGSPQNCARNLCDEQHEDDIVWDKSSIQCTYEQALQIGKDANKMFRQQRYGDAIESYGTSMHLLEHIAVKNVDGTTPYNPRLDAELTNAIFQILINTTSTFLEYREYDTLEPMHSGVARSRFQEAMACATAAFEVLRGFREHHPDHWWNPSVRDMVRLHKATAGAYQGMGDRKGTLEQAKKALAYSPSDENCRRYVATRETDMSTPLGIELLSEKLDRLLRVGSGGSFVQDRRWSWSC